MSTKIYDSTAQDTSAWNKLMLYKLILVWMIYQV